MNRVTNDHRERCKWIRTGNSSDSMNSGTSIPLCQLVTNIIVRTSDGLELRRAAEEVVRRGITKTYMKCTRTYIDRLPAIGHRESRSHDRWR